MAGALVWSLLAWVLVTDLFRRLDDTLVASAEAVRTVDATLDLADDGLATLSASLDTASAAAGQAAATAATVEEAVTRTADLVGNEIPDGIDSVRAAMPGLIEASAVIDTTLSALSLFGVPYNPPLALDEAFRQLDDRLEPIPGQLRESAEIIAGLVPETDAFGEYALDLSAQMQEMRDTIDEARTVIENRTGSGRFDELLASSSAAVRRSQLIAQVLVVVVAAWTILVSGSLIWVGRALSRLESLAPGVSAPS